MHLSHNPAPFPTKFVGINSRLQLVLEALQHHSIVGLCGMGGIGKISLAAAAFNELRHNFVDRCCYVKAGSMSNDTAMRGPLTDRQQEQILRELCGQHGPFHGAYLKRRQLQQGLRNHAALLVLDGVWSQDQLESLLVTMPPESRVIVTSRNLSLLQQYLSTLSMTFMCIEVDLLSQSESLELLCLHAFGEPRAPSDWAGLARSTAENCNGLPLTLSVIGSFLAMHREPLAWEDVCDRLQQTRRPDGLQDNDRLRITYDYLDPTLQDILMDVACVLLGCTASAAICAWGPEAMLKLIVLQKLSLVIVEGDALGMNDEMRDMLRSQVKQERFGRHQYAWDQQAADICTASNAQQVSLCFSAYVCNCDSELMA